MEQNEVVWSERNNHISRRQHMHGEACVVSQSLKGDFRISTPQVVNVDASWNSTRDGSQGIRVGKQFLKDNLSVVI